VIAALLAFAAIGWFAAGILSMRFRRSQRALADSERLVASVKASYAEYRAYSEARKDLVRRVVVPSAKPVILFRPLPLDLSIDRRLN
jgi:hypothetical protein